MKKDKIGLLLMTIGIVGIFVLMGWVLFNIFFGNYPIELKVLVFSLLLLVFGVIIVVKAGDANE